MSLYICHKKNPWIKQGDIYELFDDGFQKCRVDSKGQVVGHEGLILPQMDLMPYVMRMLNAGLDKPELRRKKPNNSQFEDWVEEELHG